MNKSLTTILLLCLLFLDCCHKDVKKDCGCDSKIVATIPDSANLVGQISYKRQLDPNDNYYNNEFWIGYTEPNCGNCIHHMIVCNDEVLSDFQYLKDSTYATASIKFSGYLKNVCVKNFHPADETFQHIILSKAEKQ